MAAMFERIDRRVLVSVVVIVAFLAGCGDSMMLIRATTNDEY